MTAFLHAAIATRAPAVPEGQLVTGAIGVGRSGHEALVRAPAVPDGQLATALCRPATTGRAAAVRKAAQTGRGALVRAPAPSSDRAVTGPGAAPVWTSAPPPVAARGAGAPSDQRPIGAVGRTARAGIEPRGSATTAPEAPAAVTPGPAPAGSRAAVAETSCPSAAAAPSARRVSDPAARQPAAIGPDAAVTLAAQPAGESGVGRAPVRGARCG
ncbi:MAG: hypothetical protein ACJ73E_11830 [Mycobacteriales bacterium]